MKVSYAAPAKVILSGEHSVVYGKPALVLGLDINLICTAEESVISPSNDLTSYIVKTVVSYLKKKELQFKECPLHLTFNSQIPSGRGLGSSAALSVAAAACCLHIFTHKPAQKELINSVAYTIEKKFHDNPSGVDVSASCFGGLIYYRKEFEFLKTISSLNFKIPQKFEDHLYLIDSGKPVESTKEMVNLVGKQYNAHAKDTAEIFSEMEKITKKMTLSIVTENALMFQECVLRNEELLETIHVVSDSTKQLLNTLKPWGVGKVTGAGGYKKGSGYILFYSEKKQVLEEYLHNHSIQYYKLHQSLQGVMSSINYFPM